MNNPGHIKSGGIRQILSLLNQQHLMRSLQFCCIEILLIFFFFFSPTKNSNWVIIFLAAGITGSR
jgi:hypothetical protein